jgi:hypothetical protein
MSLHGAILRRRAIKAGTYDTADGKRPVGRGRGWAQFAKPSEKAGTKTWRTMHNRHAAVEQARREFLRSPPASKYEDVAPDFSRAETMSDILAALG